MFTISPNPVIEPKCTPPLKHSSQMKQSSSFKNDGTIT